MNYNIENLDTNKDPQKINAVFKKIREEKAEIVVLQEVIDVNLFRKLVNDKLNDRYLIFMGQNDGIHKNAVLIRKDLNYDVEHYSHRNIPTDRRDNGELFYRDVPVVVLKDKTSGESVMAIATVHLKAGVDDFSIEHRLIELKTLGKISDYYVKKKKVKNFIVAGDFNKDLLRFNYDEFLSSRKFREVLSGAPRNRRATHVFYRQGDGTPVFRQIDAIFYTGGLRLKFSRADHGGRPFGRNKSREERINRESDHIPIIAKFILNNNHQ